MNEPKTPVRGLEQNPRKSGSVRWAIVIGLAYSLMLALFGIFVIQDIFASPDWQALVRNLMPAIMAMVGFVGVAFIARGRPATGAWMLVGSTIIGSLIIASLEQGYGLVLAVLLIFVASVFSDQLLRGRQAAYMLILGSFFAGLLVLMEFYWPLARSPQAAEEVTVAVIIEALFGLLLLIYLFVRFRSYRFSTKLALAFLLVAMVVGGAIAGFALYANSLSLTRAVGEGMYSLSQSQAQTIGSAVDQAINGMIVLSYNQSLLNQVTKANNSYFGTEANIQAQIAQLDQQWRDLVKADKVGDLLIQAPLTNQAASEIGEYADQFPENVEIFVTDRRGALVATTNPTSDYYQADEEWWQKAYNDGKGAIYISQPEYDESAGVWSILVALPVPDEVFGFPVGVLRTTIDLTYLTDLLRSVRLGETGEIYLVFSDTRSESGYSGFHEGKYQNIDRAQIAQLEAMGNAQYSRYILDDIEFLTTKANVELGVERVERGALDWLVVANQEVNEALAEVRQQTQTSLILVLTTMALAALGGIGLARFLTGPVARLTDVAKEVETGNLNVEARVETEDEVGDLARAFNSMTTQVRNLIGTLEQRVAERTQSLETSFAVSRRLSTILDQQELLGAVVEQVQEAFGYYHTQIYLLDAMQENLVMQGGTGEAGRIMLARRHSISHGRGLVGRAAEMNEPVLVPDTLSDPGWLPNPLLPETRAEAAVPIAVGEQVLGVLDIQHNVVNGLSEQDVVLLLSIANQVALAVQNARQYEQAQRRAEREAQANIIAQRIQSAESVEDVLKTAVQELSTVISVQNASIQLGGLKEKRF